MVLGSESLTFQLTAPFKGLSERKDNSLFANGRNFIDFFLCLSTSIGRYPEKNDLGFASMNVLRISPVGTMNRVRVTMTSTYKYIGVGL